MDALSRWWSTKYGLPPAPSDELIDDETLALLARRPARFSTLWNARLFATAAVHHHRVALPLKLHDGGLCAACAAVYGASYSHRAVGLLQKWVFARITGQTIGEASREAAHGVWMANKAAGNLQ